ncbi:MAG: hypothetical protein ACD_30C00097G0002 [uncultured bacterium]|uniref:Uncharacterized protein n=3 Tax=Candidatus Daviesiibacteriota TaxID=1752718 RepID=A0A0G0H967_9BACT|nr:MAG: hypothetical protein ACD_30C00097G0002 [uncultured bacterium]KKQ08604.1 MAG: hypothetical protein US19_C0021G0020 [Candidatus Daviesbacteria bacterium GW2011_GWB1_36_5]KKQ16341.1 MAG: hypothetical protein US28_C0002G0008 [Candidatus Daviesbacteria bacterium GW2011_GWA1_36_8]OGE33147.1 MAG: hypothetical protein A3C99_03935 [Candidatus Daviesbacteria bacterium RIFCSPHIGHO2_02_FULL_37_9]OGE35629.1 MAG: hypothetical protein A3E66_04240 [Candidatus Daviesbacteria bacterium RIFCSPHIGHO2_12_FU
MVPEISPNLESFRIKTADAFTSLIDDPENTPLLEKFRFTYEERRKHPWLRESGQGPLYQGLNGLTEALRSVLFFHHQESQDWLIRRNLEKGMQAEIDPTFLNGMKVSANEAVLDERILQSFARSLNRKNLRVDQLDTPELQQELRHGISIYWENTHAHGYSGDPW